MKNKIKIMKDYAIVYVKDFEILVDLEDVEKISEYKWNIMSTGYAQARIGNSMILMQRFLVDCKKSQVVDHKNNNRLDNRKDNLKVVTRAKNNQNLSISKRNTTGYRGVTFDKNANKYRVRININGKEKHIGLFQTLEEAVNRRKELEKEHYYLG